MLAIRSPMMGGVHSTRDRAAMGRGGSRPLTKLPKAGRYSNMPHLYTIIDHGNRPPVWLDQLCGQDIERDPKVFYGVGGWCVSCRDCLSWECCPSSSYLCSTRLYIKMASGLSGGFSLHQSICWAVDRGYSVLHSDATYTGTFPGDGISQARCHMRIVYMRWDYSDKVWKLDDLKHCKCKGTYARWSWEISVPAFHIVEPTWDCALGLSLVGVQFIIFSQKWVQCVPSLTFWEME